MDTVFSARNDEPDHLPTETTLKDISNAITKDEEYPMPVGVFADIWKCTFHIDRISVKVAVKAIPMFTCYPEGAKTKIIQASVYRRTESIAYTTGATSFSSLPAIVTPFAENGSLVDYLECEGAALTLLRDIIAGLQYLHANGVIHGDFSGSDVLIHGDGTARIAGFGFYLMYSEVISASKAFWTSTLKENIRWMAPELLAGWDNGSSARPSEQSDIYSFGGIMLLVFTNKVPYYYHRVEITIVRCVARSETSSRARYPELPEKYWAFMERCWSTNPRDRPSTEEVDITIRNEFDSLSRSEMNPVAYGDNLPPQAALRDLSKYISKAEDHPVARGGFADIWKCTYVDRMIAQVAVKVLQRIMHELRICANLKHANIVPIYGYTYGFGPFPAIVSRWAEEGNLSDYLKREGAALTLLRKFQILRDIIGGLQYLHANSVIHGDFTGPNVLIYADGTACVADFGLSLMYSEVVSASQASWTSTFSGNVRWMAPELLEEREDGTPVRPSKQSDVFSFGGIMLQVFTNKIPSYYLRHNHMIVLHIAKSETPSRTHYPGLPENYWPFILHLSRIQTSALQSSQIDEPRHQYILSATNLHCITQHTLLPRPVMSPRNLCVTVIIIKVNMWS
ncbi:kinase-like domain-containing protein [Suillus tomentosus]|nr:kinase-like domain-containing protein [Suillus tomentosus]